MRYYVCTWGEINPNYWEWQSFATQAEAEAAAERRNQEIANDKYGGDREEMERDIEKVARRNGFDLPSAEVFSEIQLSDFDANEIVNAVTEAGFPDRLIADDEYDPDHVENWHRNEKCDPNEEYYAQNVVRALAEAVVDEIGNHALDDFGNCAPEVIYYLGQALNVPAPSADTPLADLLAAEVEELIRGERYAVLCASLDKRYEEQDGQGFLLVRRASDHEDAELEYSFRDCDGWGRDGKRWITEAGIGTELAAHNDANFGSPRAKLLEAFSADDDDGHDAWLCWLDDEGEARVEGID